MKDILRLEFVGTGDIEVPIIISQEISRIGRDAACEVTIPNTSVSRFHGVFCKAGSLWFYKDLGSTNGSWVNSKLIPSGHVVPLLNGDFIQIADMLLKVDLDNFDSGGTMVTFFEGATFQSERSLTTASLLLFGSEEAAYIVEDAWFVELHNYEGNLTISNHSREQVLFNNDILENGRRKVTHGDAITLPSKEITAVISVIPSDILNRSNVSEPNKVIWQDHFAEVQAHRTNIETESRPQLFAPISTQPIEAGGGVGEQGAPRFRRNTVTINSNDMFDVEHMTDSEKKLVIAILFFLGASAILAVMYFVFV